MIIAIISGAGCAGKAIIPDYPSTEKALFSLSNTVPETAILSGVAQIELVTPGGYYPARAILIVKKPSYLRLELLPPVGPPDFFLAANSKEMKVLLPSKGEFYQGAPTGGNLSRFLPGQFNVEDIVSVLTCSYPRLTGNVDYLRYADVNNLRIEMKTRHGMSQIVWIRADGRQEKLERFDEKGKMLYRAEFLDYAEGSPVAGKIIMSRDSMTSIIIKFSDLTLESAKDLSIFDLPVPDGFKKIIMD